jgi:beta-lactamase class A
VNDFEGNLIIFIKLIQTKHSMKQIFLISFLLFPFLSSAQAYKEDKKLKAKILELTAGFKGDVGVYVRNLKTNKVVEINADSIFPTASLVKIPIMIGVFDKIQQGKLKYTDEIMYRDSLHYDDGIVGSLKDSAKVPLNYVVMLMETVSDNTGSLWMQALAGGGQTINELMERYGFIHTRVNSRTPNRQPNQKMYGWGQTTPREISELLTMIRQGKIISPDASDRMYRNLGRQAWDGEGLSQLPENVRVMTKNGAVNKSRSEVVLVHAPHGEYVYAVITKNQKDERWERNNEGYELLRKVASLLWNYYEPKANWKPVEGYEKWW